MLGIIREIIRETVWISRFLVGGMLDSVRRNTGWAVLALILSGALWVVVTGEQNPPKVDVFPSPIPVEAVNVPSNLGVLGDVQFVRVRVSALPESWVRLTPGSFRASADLSGARPGTQDVGVRVVSNDNQVRILEVLPPRIPVMVETLDSRRVAVKVNLLGTAPLGVSVGNAQTSLAAVTARGPTALVAQVESAAVDIPLEGMRVPINTQSFRLLARNAAGTRIEGVTLDPPTVDVALAVEQHITYRSVSVLPAIQGQPPDGYWVSSLRVDPPVVTVAGAREALEPLTFLSTQPIDVTRMEGDAARAVAVVLPTNLTLIEPRTGSVLAFVSVSPIQGTEVFSVPPSFEGLGSDLKAAAESVSVMISGPLPRLRQLKPTDIIVTVDVRGLGVGTHLIRPRVTLPSGLDIVRPASSSSVLITGA